MRRRLFNLATAVSLVLCVATVVLWARCHIGVHGDVINVDRDGDGSYDTYFASQAGVLVWAWHPQPGPSQPNYSWRIGGFIFYAGPNLWGGGYFREWAVPHWFLIALTGITPAFWLVARTRRPPKGICSTCGYDLRATPERCPECGTVAIPAAAPTAG
jgi:hypothetical protein